MKKEIVIGINWEQNSTAALMINGRIISCVSEERFSRVKNDERYPKKAIEWILKKNKQKLCTPGATVNIFKRISKHVCLCYFRSFTQCRVCCTP